MNNYRVYGIIVVYNKSVEDIEGYRMLKASGMELIICDNSTIDNNNREICNKEQLHYLNMNKNAGLSVAYNKALDYIFDALVDTDKANNTIICIFDDDTKLPTDYTKRLEQFFANEQEKIMLPIVYDNIGIMSPVIMRKNICKRFASKAIAMEYDRRYISGINSGMAIRGDVLLDYRYNEDMFLDYIDHQFIRDMRDRGIYPGCQAVEIEQNFSAVNDDKKSAAERFRRQKRDLKIFYKNDMIAYYIIVIKKHIKLCLKYRDIGLLFDL